MENVNEAWSRSYHLSRDPAETSCIIRQALFDLAAELQRRREIHREVIHRALIVAVHTDSLWDDQTEDAKQEAKETMRWR